MSVIQKYKASGNLKSWHDFRSGVFDDLSGNNDDVSVVSSNPFFNRDGLFFDGVNDSLTTTDLDIAQDITIFALFNPTQFDHAGGGGFQRIIEKRASCGLSINSSGRVTLTLNGLSDASTSTASSISTGEWVVIIFSYNSTAGTTTAFLNGIQDAQDTSITGSLNQSNYAVEIGDRNAGGRAFYGTIGAVGIMDVGIDATEASQLTSELLSQQWPSKPRSKTQATQLQQTSGLTSQWIMEPVNNEIIDITGAGNDASIVGNPTFVNTILGPGATIGAAADMFDTGSDWIGTSALTFGCWLNLDGWGGINVGRIFSNIKAVLKVNDANDNITFTSDGFDTEVQSATNSIKLNNLTFVCVTRTAAGVTNFYVDGVLSGSADQDSGTPSGAGTSNVIVGNRSAGSRQLEGTVIEPFAIVGTVETATQIAARYEKGAKLVQYKTDWAVNVSVANVTSGQLENSDFWNTTGTHKIETDTHNGQLVKVINPVVGGTLTLRAEALNDDNWKMYVDQGAGYVLVESGMMASNVLTTTTGEKIIFADLKGDKAITKKLGVV